MKTHNPPNVAGPFATYAHGVEVDEPVRMLFGAGQTGVAGDGSVGEGIVAQSELVWDNIREEEILELEGLFRHIYRKDARANKLNKQRGFAKLKRVAKHSPLIAKGNKAR